MKKHWLLSWLIYTLLLALSLSPVRAQNTVVSGRVTDTSGGVVANVAVELTNHATQIKSATRSNSEGIFVFPSMPPGNYELNARIPGFTASRIESVTLEVGQSKSLDITLTPGTSSSPSPSQTRRRSSLPIARIAVPSSKISSSRVSLFSPGTRCCS